MTKKKRVLGQASSSGLDRWRRRSTADNAAAVRDRQLRAQAHLAIYSRQYLHHSTLNSQVLRDVYESMAKNNPTGHIVVLKERQIPKYIAAETEVFDENLRADFRASLEASFGNPFCQGIHDGKGPPIGKMFSNTCRSTIGRHPKSTPLT